ncbi:MAG: glycerate kinase [Mesorhizobium sp.]|nr:glycerate kinase [Mesorhizobium sp.]
MFAAAIAAAQPSVRLPDFLPQPPTGRTVVVGAGKASASMARALEQSWAAPLSGCVVTRDGHESVCERIEVLSASHPTPDQRSVDAAYRLMREVATLTKEDLVIALISGGGSSLLTMPAPGLTLADKQDVNTALLAGGASISEINCVRRQISGIKNGGLARAAAPASVVTLLISDVPGDDPAVIASGPTIMDASKPSDALAILSRYCIDPPRVRAFLERKGALPEPALPGPQVFGYDVIARPQASLEAAASIAARTGAEIIYLGDDIQGESRLVANEMAQKVREICSDRPSRPVVLISGGETTVTIRGTGRGGRNVEFLLALGLALEGVGGVHAIAGDTDGIDGIEEIAGAVIGPSTMREARQRDLDPLEFLNNNDAHTFFELMNSQVITGPTMTNVNDFRAIIISPLTKGEAPDV